ncbi:DUF6623 family protein [Spirosoma linguale]|uniref:Uncharacterized protein n=1 Tax=Spirosoma linguale (strain ATCC 33905 / DSM 74 / LMG 10896 / Claus 1) TaxID=504472 RepID=D2QIB3_SPILD|nr:hypothetical protein Slin_2681 [Spirosoma linguale DSM 74]
MAIHASWIQGNALTVESPELLNRIGHFGWGADMSLKPGKGSWFHIPIPSPVLVPEGRTKIQRFFLLFDAEGGSIRNVHLYDGSAKIQEFNNLLLTGEHRVSIDAQNGFTLSAPHVVAFGIGISFFFIADIGFDSAIPPSRLIVGSAGGDFFV